MLDDGLNKTIKIFGSINRLAKKLGLPRVTISAWRNRNVHIPLERAYQIEWATNGEVAWDQLVSPDVARIVKRCCLPFDNVGYQFESIYLSTTRIKYLNEPSNNISSELDCLINDINQKGLQKPICVDAKNNLIFGTKRLQVYQLLNKKTIPAWRISLSDLLNNKYSSEELAKTFLISERVAIGIALEKLLGNRQGQRTDRQPLVQNSAQVKSGKKTRGLIAEQLGFGSHFTYQEAKKIKSLSTPALIDAVDKGYLSISTAALLTQLPPKEQTKVLVLSIKEIIFVASQLRNQKTAQRTVLTGAY